MHFLKKLSPSHLYPTLRWKYHQKFTPRILPTLSAPYSERYVLQKSTLEPQLQKLQDQIIYSEYVERSNWHISFINMKKLEEKTKFLETKDKMLHDLTIPPQSVALKYLNSVALAESQPEENVDETEENCKKHIYMPYAVEDKVEIVENPVTTVDVQEVEEDFENSINEKYKIEYDELYSKKKNEENKYTQWRDDITAVPAQWMSDYPVFDDSKLKQDTNEDPWAMKYGTAEPESKITNVACGGCGALLHCKDPNIPGYIPSELFIYKHEKELKSYICQRCHFMKTYNMALDVKISADDYPKMLSKIKTDKVKAAVLIIDLMDFPCCIWPNLHDVIGKVPIFLVGNKVDLLPQDNKHFFRNVKEHLVEAAVHSGIDRKSIVDIALISAKTHFGIEEFINKMFKLRRKGNVYLVGCTNVGKSSLFNALLQSDYCKISAVDLVQRATVAPWPGTTLNLLKFPITRAGYVQMAKRIQRLIREREERLLEREHLKQQYKETRNITFATLQSRIRSTFAKSAESLPGQKLNDLFNFHTKDDSLIENKRFGLDENKIDFRLGNWCFDTPGTIQPEQILHLLTTEELLHTLPKQIIMPRSFVLHSNQTLFLAGLGRLDVLEADGVFRVTVFASSELPVTICSTENADNLYQELLRTKAFVVPVPDEDRLKVWPEMKNKEFKILGDDERISVADVLLSSAGWVSITPKLNVNVHLRAWTPEGRGIYLRRPALLPHSTALRGARIRKTPAYKKTRIEFGHEY